MPEDAPDQPGRRRPRPVNRGAEAARAWFYFIFGPPEGTVGGPVDPALLPPAQRRRYERQMRVQGAANARLLTFAGALVLLVLTVTIVGYILFTRAAEARLEDLTPNFSDEAIRLLGAPPEPVEELTLAPERLEHISADGARSWNAAIPFAAGAVPAAAPFQYPTLVAVDYARALDCLTAAIYYEAGAETAAGQLAVAQVVLNRLRHPAYPHTVCGVVFEGSNRATGCQFTFSCDGSLSRRPSPAGWARARTVAQAALNGLTSPTVGTATHYHTDWVAPYWAKSLDKVSKIGTHIFYRWPGAWGRPTAFRSPLRPGEPVIGSLGAKVSESEDSLSEVGGAAIAGSVAQDPNPADAPIGADGAPGSPAPIQTEAPQIAPTPTVQVTVLGEVKRPGSYAFSGEITVLKVIYEAGGYGYRANTKKLFLKRAGQTTETKMPMDEGLVLQPGDTIRIGERLF